VETLIYDAEHAHSDVNINRVSLGKRVSQIDLAIIAEMARWGDARGNSNPYTKNDNWIPEINNMRNNYFPERTAIVIDQLKSAKIYSSPDAPVVKRNTIEIKLPYSKFEESISVDISNPGNVGIIYYTFDGTNPGEIDGKISESTKLYNDYPFSINSTTVLKTRVYYNGNWRAIKQVNFLKTNEDFSSLKVTELHYHPLDYIVGIDTTEGKKLEFIEFKNTGNRSLNLSGLVLDSAVYYEFPENEILNSGEFYIVSSKTDKFYEFYGMESSGNYKGYFSNGGEEVLLHDSNGNAIIHFTYDDKSPWPEEPDGDGNSLVSAIRNPEGDPNQHEYWASSVNISGSPFADEPYNVSSKLIAIQNTDMIIYPNPTNDILNIKVDNSNFETEMNIAIYSISGVLMYQNTHPLETTLSLRQLNLLPAFYIVKVNCQNFSKSYKICLTE
ncbi:MAG: lamin tail domain-containing protein, partial [Draconibacterium sp.]|nr:lamin tail domain-containing protein [Draconibacterium sp.]